MGRFHLAISFFIGATIRRAFARNIHCAADGIFSDWSGALNALYLLDELGLEPAGGFAHREVGAHG